MQRTVFISLAIAAAAVPAVYFYTQSSAIMDTSNSNALVAQYCVDCHNSGDFAGSLRLDNKDVAAVGQDAEIWEHVVKKLKTGMMPPADAPRPDREMLDAFAAELELRLDDAAAENPIQNRTALRRLNRTEYANAIRDLLRLDVDAATLLPLDDSSEGFDNIATALGVSPSLIESYISGAMKISRWSLGDPTTPRTQYSFAAPQRLNQDRHLEGLPLGTRGGLRINHTFPLDAEYEFQIRRGFRMPRTARIEITLDGLSIPLENTFSFRIPVTAGPHTLTASIIDSRRPSGVDDIYAQYESNGAISSIEIDGPLTPTGIGNTPSRRRILTCEPNSTAAERECAQEITETLATRAFRRPLTREELPELMDFYDAGRIDTSFEAGIQHVLARILVDPRFLYRIENEPNQIAPGTIYRIDDLALASRLSFFLWSSIPDDELLGLAVENRLSDPVTLEAQVRRMLKDQKADAIVENFAAQWLFLRELESVTPDSDAFDENLRRSMLRETKLLVSTIMRDDLSIIRLLDAPFTFVDERLAEHYGFSDIFGSHFRRIDWPADSPRKGLLGHGSILTVTSVTSRTSPVIRGSWILESLLGSAVPTPPPNVETTLEGDDGEAVASSVRERLEAHRSNPVCASCHAIMDPIGFTLENFDLTGAWRDTDGGQAIDSHTTLTDGTMLEGPVDLRNALLDRSDAFVATATEKLLTYALGRGIEYYDMPTVRAITRQAATEDHRFSALVLGIVQSEAFQTRVKAEN